jgi:hypothetical protein
VPTRKQHIAAALRHLEAYRHLRHQFPDWASVALFYSALHVVEAAFEAEGRHNNTHQQRELYIKERHRALWQPYHRLQNESMKARYLQGGAFSLGAEGVENELRRQKFRQVHRYVRGLLAGAQGLKRE